MPANSTSGSGTSPQHGGWKDKGPYRMPKWELEDDVVISGFSGRFPESNNVEELKKNLFEGTDMITENDRRWKPGLYGTPKRMGKLKEIDKFDSLFFGVHGKQADAMDPMHRILLESTYEAIFDAGYDPSGFKGKSVGVFVGCSDRSASADVTPEDLLTGYELIGNSIAMLANRVSFTFGFTGPSMSVDSACSSTMHALNEAFLAIKNNRCEAAVVGGGTISLSVNQTVSFTRLGLVSQEGTCKVFDNTANGYVRSEAVGAIFLQRGRDARRCYATVLHCKINNDGSKPEVEDGIAIHDQKKGECFLWDEFSKDVISHAVRYGLASLADSFNKQLSAMVRADETHYKDYPKSSQTSGYYKFKSPYSCDISTFCQPKICGITGSGISYPSSEQQVQLFKEVFSELDMDPADIDYVEAHGTGTVIGDRQESNAIGQFFCPGRKTPLLVGSVKSNLGHAEAASGTCSIAKILLSMEEGFIAPNLHYKDANAHVPALVEGKMKVVSEKTPWKPGIAAANNFGFGGSNVNLVLKANQKEQKERKERKIPRLALISGRSEQGVKYISDKIQEEQFTDEALLLLEEACKAPTQGMRFRGYALVQKPGEELSPVIKSAPVEKRPVWFLFSGMGSQWSGMAKDMMKMNVFANSIKLSAQVLKPVGVDLIHLLTEATEDELNHIVAPFVTIAAVQIALVDLVKSLGLTPDGIIGHSVGELGCAYSDGCFTAEQMMLAAYWRGKSCTQVELIHGAMAAIGMTWDEAKTRCPEGVYPVCHNADDSVTISGPAEKVKTFVQELTAENIFARNVKTCDIAFHSKYVEPASHIMKKELAKVIPNPLPRSPRWISSSVPEEEWEQAHAQLSSVDYHVNNLLSPVLFNEAMASVPKNAIIIEFAPHSLLQAIVKRTLGPESIYISFMKRKHEDNLLQCLTSIGKLYTSGLNPTTKDLYDPISYPVPRGTPMLNSLIQWNHSAPVYAWSYEQAKINKDLVVMDTMKGSPHEYLLGHKVDGRILFPFMGYVYLAWQALARDLQRNFEEIPVIIEDFSVYRATMMPKNGEYMLQMKFLNCDGTFRVTDSSGSIVASGRIRQGDDNTLRMDKEMLQQLKTEEEEEENKQTFVLNAGDFYKELRLRGYEYGPTFQGVLQAESSGLRGKVKWENRWVSFMDSMLQISILSVPLRALLLPTRVKSIKIDPRKKPQNNEKDIEMEFNPYTNTCRAGPVEVEGMHCGIAPKKFDHQSCPVLEESVFIPDYDYHTLTEEQMSNVEEYAHVCATFARTILLTKKKNETEISTYLTGTNNVSEELKDKFLMKDDNTYIILKALKEIQDCDSKELSLAEIAQEVLTKKCFNFDQDFLSTQIMNERALRSALDIVQDNHFSPKMKILELSGESIIHQDVLKMLSLTTLGIMKFDYLVMRMNEEPIPEGVLDAGVKTKIAKLNEEPFPGENDLVVAKNIFTDCSCTEEVLPTICASLKSGGFCLLIERTNISPAEKFIVTIAGKQKKEQSESYLEELFRKYGLAIMCKKKDQMTSVLYLLKKQQVVTENGQNSVTIPISEDNGFLWVNDLQTALKENEEGKLNRSIWLTADNPSSGLIGFINCLKQEPGGRFIRCFFDCDQSSPRETPRFEFTNPYFKDIFQKDLLFNVVKNGCLGMFRHRLLDSEPELQPYRYSFLNVMKRGDLSSLKWIWNPVPNLQDPDSVPIEIYYSAVNFRDIMLASGKLPPDAIPEKLALQECILGLEFVGRAPSGKRVMGFTMAKALATHITIPKEHAIDVPSAWTMEEASTVLVVYITSYYALLMRGQLKRNESVLIHSGTGGVGQAAIAISLSMGCQVFTTVGSDEKKEALKALFPEINERHIYSSRDILFESQIMNATQGKGVDLVLNSLGEEKLQASVRCLGANGRFLEIGKYDIAMNNNLGMAVFNKNLAFHGIFLDTLFHSKHRYLIPMLMEQLKEGVKSGVVRPLKATVFNWNQAEEAFRFMASGKHIGKVVIKIREEESERMSIPMPLEIPAIPRTFFDERKSYIVTGALGGFGFELVTWLVERGARKVVLSARSAIKNEYQKLWIQRWQSDGASILISNDDLSSVEGVKTLLKMSEAMGPIGGIFHLAMVLSDGLFENLKPGDFENVALSKVRGVRNLDKMSREMCPDLNYFVVFSSISCGRGNPGQSNYGYANSVMERVVEHRKEDGLPGLAIQWGGIGDVGVVYEKMGGNEVILKGTVPQRLNSCFDVMDRFMQQRQAVLSSFVPLEKAAFSTESNEDVVALLCKVLGVKDPSSINPEMTLGELGMDSLMGVEIKQMLESEYDTVLSVPEVRQLSIADLKEIGKKKKPESSSSKLSTGKKEGGIILMSEMFIPTESIICMSESSDPRCIFFVHPAEGHVKMLNPLANNIKCKVYGLQYTTDVPSETIQDIAAFYVKKMKEVQPHGPYRLVGYSYGTLLAFEMALLLQKTDLVKSLVCVDGSPKAVTEATRKFVTKIDRGKAQYNKDGLMILLHEYFGNVPIAVENALLNTREEDTAAELKRFMEPHFGQDFDIEIAERLGERCYKLFRAAKIYKSTRKFKGRITLVKSTEGDKPVECAKEEDYGLKEIVDGDVEVFSIKCHHKTIAEDQSNEICKIINDRI